MNPVVGPRVVSALIVSLACALPAWGQNQPGSGQASGAAAAPAKPKAGAAAAGNNKGGADEKSQVSYSIGVTFGEELHGFGLGSDALSSEKVAQGVRDALAGKAKVTPDDRQKIQTFIQTAHQKMTETNHAAAKAFLDENGKKKDIQTTASGLQYQVMTPGSGDSPKATDEVTVNYRGRLLDGTEFDSSYKRGQPATFRVNGVIPAWREALVLMKPGAKWQLFAPPALAYDANSPPPIPPGSLLIFDIELIKVNPTPAPAPGIGPRVPMPQSSPQGSQPQSPPPK